MVLSEPRLPQLEPFDHPFIGFVQDVLWQAFALQVHFHHDAEQCLCFVGDLQVQGQAHLAILSGLVYNLETITTVIAEETMYESSVVQYFTEKGIEQGIQESI